MNKALAKDKHLEDEKKTTTTQNTELIVPDLARDMMWIFQFESLVKDSPKS